MKSFLIMLGATIIAVLLVFNVFSDPSHDNPEQQVAFSKIVYRPHLANAALESIVKKDSQNIILHYQLLSNVHETWDEIQMKIIHSDSIPDLSPKYQRLVSSTSPRMQDIGNFGLGVIEFYKKDYDNAMPYLNQIKDNTLPDVNFILGEIAWEKGDQKESEKRYEKEIALKGNVNESKNALAWMYYYNKDDSKFAALAYQPASYEYLPFDPAREFYFKTGAFISYYTLILYHMFHRGNILALLSAFLIALVWMLYLRLVDVFEKERWLHILLALALGALFSFTTYPIEDLVRVLTGTPFINEYYHSFLYCVIGIGLLEEVVKIIPFLLLIRFSGIVKKPIDYIIYASVCALGFSMVENVLYFKSGSLDTIVLRGLISTVIHMFMTSIIAYGLVLSKYRKSINVYAAFFFYLLNAAVFHGAFDFFLFNGSNLFIIALFSFPPVFVWGIFINNALNQSATIDSDQEINPKKMTSFLIYSFPAIFITAFLIEGYWFGPTITLQNVSGNAFLCIPFMAIVSVRLTNYDIIPTYWSPLQLKGFTIMKAGYDVMGLHVKAEPFKADSPLDGYGAITGVVVKDIMIEDIHAHILKLDRPLNIAGEEIKEIVIGPKEDDEPVGLTPDVICYFMLIPDGLNLESKELEKRDFEFVDWVNVNKADKITAIQTNA